MQFLSDWIIILLRLQSLLITSLCLQCSVVCFVVSWYSLNKSEFAFFICSYLFFVQLHLDGLTSG